MNDDILTQVRKHRIIVAMRGVPPERMTAAAQAMYEGGIRMLEITFNQNDPQTADRTAAAIRAVNAAMGRWPCWSARGTVLTAAQARAAVEAGAKYLLSPNLDLEVMAEARRLGTAMIPGAMTPSEVACAWKAGRGAGQAFPGRHPRPALHQSDGSAAGTYPAAADGRGQQPKPDGIPLAPIGCGGGSWLQYRQSTPDSGGGFRRDPRFGAGIYRTAPIDRRNRNENYKFNAL